MFGIYGLILSHVLTTTALENPEGTHPSYWGPTGNLHSFSAITKEPSSFGLGLTTRFFTKTPFIDARKHSRVGLRLSGNVSLPAKIELFGGSSFTFNEHSTSTGSNSATSFGENSEIGLKWGLPFGTDSWHFATLLSGRFLSGTQIARNTSGFASDRSGPMLQGLLYFLGTYQGSRLWEKLDPLLHFNLGYRTPNSNITPVLSSPANRDFDIDQFNRDAFAYHAIVANLGLEAQMNWATPFLEYQMEYALATGADPVRFQDNRQTATLGSRFLPHESFSLMVAASLGLFGKTTGRGVAIPVNPPWELYAGASFSSLGRTLFEAEGRIQGSVRDADTGLPLPDVQVRIQGSPLLPAVTNTAGQYQINRLQDGNYQLRFEVEGYETVTRSFAIESGERVMIDANLRRIGSRTGDLFVLLRDATTDAPISRAFVSVSEVSQSFSSDAEGRVRLQDVPEGPKFIRVEASGFIPADFSVEIFPDEQIQQTFYLQPEPEKFGNFEGVVRNPDGTGLTAVFTDLSESISPFGTNPLTGQFNQVLPEGTHRFRVQAENYLPQEIEIEVIGGQATPLDITLARPEKATLLADQIILPDAIYFAFDSDAIQEQSLNVLDQVVEVLKEVPDFGRLRIEGHSDSIGNANYNLNLSQRRAESVKRYLVSQGLAEDQLVAVGFGAQQPIATNETNEGRSENRRVEFHLERPKQ